MIAGAQVPITPLIEVVGRAPKTAPEQIGATGLNVGVNIGLTVIVNVAVFEHCPASGVNVYVVVVVLSNAGNHEPKTPLFEVVGSTLNAAPAQIGATAVKVGVKIGLTVTVIVVVVAH